jgi:hypothetical protein
VLHIGAPGGPVLELNHQTTGGVSADRG